MFVNNLMARDESPLKREKRRERQSGSVRSREVWMRSEVANLHSTHLDWQVSASHQRNPRKEKGVHEPFRADEIPALIRLLSNHPDHCLERGYEDQLTYREDICSIEHLRKIQKDSKEVRVSEKTSQKDSIEPRTYENFSWRELLDLEDPECLFDQSGDGGQSTYQDRRRGQRERRGEKFSIRWSMRRWNEVRQRRFSSLLPKSTMMMRIIVVNSSCG